MSRLQPTNLLDFSGGLNVRDTDFQVADNESPGMLNMEMDPRGGFKARAGWSAMNSTQVVADPANNWRPRNAELHAYSNGAYGVFIANGINGKVWAAQGSAPFVDTGATGSASPHICDFAGWSDSVYMALGRESQVAKLTNAPAAGNVVTLLNKAGTGTWNPDYTVYLRGVAPASEHMEPHGGYMFAANTKEDGNSYPNRVRWSHPDEPEDWAENDYIDIGQGGSKITGLRSFRDHLVIFKVDSVWALYGYDLDSWQLIKISQSIGVPSPQAITKSEDTVYFYSASGRNGIYAYQGSDPVLISEKIRLVMQEITNDHDVWLGWIGRRLWCSLPWDWEAPAQDSHGSVLVFDPSLSGGSWLRHKPARGTIACIVERSDVATELPLVVTCGCTGHSGAMRVDAIPDRAGDRFSAAEGVIGFRSRYRTNWKHAGWPELQKSWLRPRIIARVPVQSVAVRMDTYWNYDSANTRRTHTFDLTAGGGVFWRETGADEESGFDWKELGAADPSGRGANWQGPARIGDTIVRPHVANAASRGSSLGWARAVQLEFSPEDHTLGLPWGIDAVVLKHNVRRFTT